MDQLTLSCPNCAQPVAEADRYCEECGIDLAAARAATPDPRTGLPAAPAIPQVRRADAGDEPSAVFAAGATGTGDGQAAGFAERGNAGQYGAAHPLGGAAAPGGYTGNAGQADTQAAGFADHGTATAPGTGHPLGGEAAGGTRPTGMGGHAGPAEAGSGAVPGTGHPLGGAAAVAGWPGGEAAGGGHVGTAGHASATDGFAEGTSATAPGAGLPLSGAAAAAGWAGGEAAGGTRPTGVGGEHAGPAEAGSGAVPGTGHPLGGAAAVAGWPGGEGAGGAAAGSGMTGDFVLAAPVLVSEEEGAEEGPRCVGCGAQRIDSDGYCEVCGRAQPRPRDHQERALAGVCGVSDRGHRHHRNEDAFAVAATSRPGGAPAVVAVVCDGVSSATRPDEASQAAADSASESLLEQLESGEAPETAMEKAILAAAARVDSLAEEFEREPSRNSPACTIVSAVVAGGRVTVGWVGDSRAYWMPDDRSGATRLTVDDSWATRMVEAGLMSEAEAFADPRAHAITGWLGADAIEVEPHTLSFVPETTGTVLICTDGLWNYLEAAADLAAVVPADARTRPLQAAQTLVRYACDRGGHDNITVALLPIDRVEGVDASEPDHPATLAIGTLDSPTIQLREGES